MGMIRLTLITFSSWMCWNSVVIGVWGFQSSLRNENKTLRKSCTLVELQNGFPVGDVIQNKIYGDTDREEDNVQAKNLMRKDRQRQMKLDGLEPYVLVSAITSSASFEVITQGNYFSDNTILSPDGSINLLKALVLITSTFSSTLGVYALGVFSFSILYSKAALAREYDDIDDLEIYDDFITKTAKFRYKGFLCFYRSLQLFILNLFLFAFGYLPEEAHSLAIVASILVAYFVSKDLEEIVDAGKIIFSQPVSPEKD
ncbi:hypothetical protein CTEN210_02160 [Chaetoceros tenuissimus]|uniref:Uncharacterized protein n=1 Tax=Chaetoceros tenuissimus TaxID=426638 RepID=A0AAD3CH23_9STRA|nr:hypothetical protein CTEN210_02160 [Chaetoceros tenuissimus]